MPDSSQLPHLLRLLDDDDAVVREAVLAELASFGAGLGGELERMNLVLSTDQTVLLGEYTRARVRAWLLDGWSAWFAIPDEKEKLEAALTLIAEYQENRQRPGHLRRLLDGLATEYRALHQRPDLRELSRFLFTRKKLTGAQQDYYDPRNSNLSYVIEHRRGIPISLACVYMLVGDRLGLQIDGCNFPGHFLAMATVDERPIIIDCFHGGLFLDDTLLARYMDPVAVSVAHLTTLRSDSATIVARVVRNLVNAYRTVGRPEESDLMKQLLEMMGVSRGEED